MFKETSQSDIKKMVTQKNLYMFCVQTHLPQNTLNVVAECVYLCYRYVYMCVCIYLYICVYVCIYACICVYVCMCVYVYIYTV